MLDEKKRESLVQMLDEKNHESLVQMLDKNKQESLVQMLDEFHFIYYCASTSAFETPVFTFEG